MFLDGRKFEFDEFLLDAKENVLLRGGRPLPVTPKAFRLLLVLVENHGHLVEKDTLMNTVWADSFVEEANLPFTIGLLRKALNDNAQNPHFIETVPKRGYRFIADVKHIETGAETDSKLELTDNSANDFFSPEELLRPIIENESSGTVAARAEQRRGASIEERRNESTKSSVGELKDVDSLHPSGSDREQRSAFTSRLRILLRRRSFVMVGLLGLSVLLLWLNVGGLRERLFGPVSPVQIQSVAVLPFVELSGDSPDYLADAVTDALITDLSRVGVPKVVSKPVVIEYKGIQKPVAVIGRELKVDAVLSGSVARSGESVRISVQLTHAATDRILWSESYERNLRDMPALQREMISTVIGKISNNPAQPAPEAQIRSARPVVPEAYENYLRGRFYAHRQNKDDNEAAIKALEQAVAADPTFAPAYAELSQAYVWKLFLFAPAERQWEEKAFVAAEKALSLDPDLAGAYLARGRLLWTPANHFPHEKAIREYRRALSLNPLLDEARNQLALVYSHIGAFDEAIEESRKAVTANPNNNLAQFRIGQTLNFQGKFEQSLSVLRALPKEVNPALVGHQTVWALFNLGRKEEAAATLEQFLRDYPADEGGLFTSLKAILAASSGQEVKAEAEIRLAVEKGKGFGHFHHTAYHIACAYALMNKPEQAIKWLEAAFNNGFPCYPLLEKDVNLDNLRQDSRFVVFLDKQRQQWEYYRTIL
jgi:DNA-binding winged helix-turn-helix (wHTH) protein/TolB-like protein